MPKITYLESYKICLNRPTSLLIAANKFRSKVYLFRQKKKLGRKFRFSSTLTYWMVYSGAVVNVMPERVYQQLVADEGAVKGAIGIITNRFTVTVVNIHLCNQHQQR